MHKTATPSNAGLLDALVLDAIVPVPAFVRYTREDLQKMTKLCIDFFL